MTLTTLRRFNLTNQINAWRGGTGPSVVLIHGVGLNADAWYAMLPGLLEKYTVTAIDLPGHGHSATMPTRSEPTLNDFTSIVCDALNECDGPSVVIGHSMGALIAMDLACHHPKNIDAAIPLNAVFRRSNAAHQAVQTRAKDLRETGKIDNTATLQRWFGENPQGELEIASDRCERMLNATSLVGYATAYTVFAHNDGPTNTVLENSTVPMLFITGEEEPNSTPAMSQELAALTPDGQCLIIDNARHMMPITHAQEVNQNIDRFLQSKGIHNA